jgi:glycosyltransferase involved in cell wall biosynthesis
VKILHIYKDYFPVVGGMENHIRLLAEAQAAQGHDVTVLVTSLNGTSHVETINGVRVIFAARVWHFSSAPFSIEMFQRVAHIETDITHLHSPYPYGEMANYFFGHARATILTYQSDIVRQRITGPLYTPMLHRVLAHVKTIIATSPNYIETSPVLRHWKTKCVVIPLGLPCPPPPAVETLSAQRRRGELLFVGRLRYYKGVNYLLEAMPFLPTAHLTIVGIGPKEAEWKKLAEDLGLADRVTWAGEVSDAKLPGYYAACDVFVLPCSERSEAFGAVQLEAMAAGKPVVSCDVKTGVAWVNQNERTGLVVPPKNPLALGAAITRLLDDPVLRAQMGAAGRKRFESEFTVEKMMDRVMQVYVRALQVA